MHLNTGDHFWLPTTKLHQKRIPYYMYALMKGTLECMIEDKVKEGGNGSAAENKKLY